MLSISGLLITALALSTARAVPGATPSANARTTSQNSRDVLYSYGYVVDAPEYRNFYDHEEDRRGDVTQGRFRVALPDNRLQTVTYRAGRKGYSAQISYDEHPNFQSLRAAVGPIREAPEIGQSVVTIPRRENWKNGERHSHQVTSNNVDSSTSRRKARPTVTPSRPVAPPPSPTPVHRKPTPGPFKPRQTTTRRPQRDGQFTTRNRSTTRSPRLGPIAQKLVSSPHMPEQASIFVSTEGLEDTRILNRLIEAIKTKQEEELLKNPESSAHGHDDDEDSDERHTKEKPRYTIKDKAGVQERLRAIVHTANISRFHAARIGKV